MGELVKQQSETREAPSHEAEVEDNSVELDALQQLSQIASGVAPPPPKPNSIIQLQATVGNRALQRLLQRQAQPRIRRINGALLLKPETIVHLQSIIGNQAVQRLLQRQAQPHIQRRSGTIPYLMRRVICESSTPANSQDNEDVSPPEAGDNTAAENNTIHNAIDLFRRSGTRGAHPLGQRVLSRLQSLHDEGELVYTARLPDRTGARTLDEENREEYADIWVNDNYRNNVVETAINLVHEAVHHIARESDVYIDEELRCRDIEIGFYTELQNEGIRVGEQVVRAQQGMRPGLEQQREWRNHNQLVDGVMVLYRNAATLYEVGWVVQHLNDWGGLQNRWRTTKAYFLRELVQEPGAYVDQVCQVLESIDPSHFRQIVGWVGCDDFDDGIRQLRRGLNIDWNHSNLRISELEHRFNIRLRGTRADAARRTMRPPN